MAHPQPLADRFWSKVDKNGPTAPHMDTPCWVWTAGKTAAGYAQVWDGEAMRRGNRVAWRLAHGEPGDLHVLHRCDNRACVRPDHMYLGTHQDNMTDRKNRNRTFRLVGEAHHNAVLTEDLVREIRARAEAGDSLRTLAKAYGVSKYAISCVTHRTSWRHVA